MKKIPSRAYENEWNMDVLHEYDQILHDIAVGEWGYKIYPLQYEIITSEGMLEAYSSSGLPLVYPHWSFGKSFLHQQRMYKRGYMGLAYEIVINSSPCIAYLMEENTLTMQILVMAHAGYGHNHFFKNNYLFRQWTDADYIIDYMRFAKHYVEDCEVKYGYEEVEAVLDAAHAIAMYSVDKYPRRKKGSKEIETNRKKRIDWDQAHYNSLNLNEFVEKDDDESEEVAIDPTENLLYFIEKNAPALKEWEREIVRIVRKINQYFYPQRYTQLMNEGFATFTHWSLCEELDRRGLVDEAFMLEFCHSHSNVVFQPDYNDPRWNGRLNPYKLGWEMFKDIRRICETPTREDQEWFPQIVGKPFRNVMFDAVENFKDESFIQQFLSPTLMRKMRMFSLLDEADADVYKVTAIHNEDGFRHVRNVLAKNWDTNTLYPQIQVEDVAWKQDRRLILRHDMSHGRTLQTEEAEKVLEHIYYLWRFPVEIQSIDSDGEHRDRILFKTPT